MSRVSYNTMGGESSSDTHCADFVDHWGVESHVVKCDLIVSLLAYNGTRSTDPGLHHFHQPPIPSK